MSLTSYRAAPPRVELGGQRISSRRMEVVMKGFSDEDILFVDLAATYSPAP
jgi:hypothetical protein